MKISVAILLGIFAGALLCEGLVRLVIPEQPLIPRNVVDSGFGVRTNLPGVSYRQYYPDNFDVRVTVNRAGLRSEQEYAREEPAGTYRIALVGDSFVFGYGVGDREVVSKVLEDALNRDPELRPRKFEVLNFGVSGTGQAEQLLIYRNQVRAYAPDRVVLFFFNNDIGENVVSGLFSLDEQGGARQTGTSFLPAVRVSELVGRSAVLRWLSEHSQAFGFFRVQMSVLAKRRMADDRGFADYDTGGDQGAPLTQALVRLLVEEVSRDSTDPILYVIPDYKRESSFPLTPDEVRRAGGQVFDGRDVWERRQYFPVDLHWTPLGHRQAAGVLYRQIRNGILNEREAQGPGSRSAARGSPAP